MGLFSKKEKEPFVPKFALCPYCEEKIHETHPTGTLYNKPVITLYVGDAWLYACPHCNKIITIVN